MRVYSDNNDNAPPQKVLNGQTSYWWLRHKLFDMPSALFHYELEAQNGMLHNRSEGICTNAMDVVCDACLQVG